MAGLICAAPLALWYAAIYTPGDKSVWAAFMRVHPAALLPGPLNTSFAVVTEMLPAVWMAAAFLIAEAFGAERARRPALLQRRRFTRSLPPSLSCSGRAARRRAITCR